MAKALLATVALALVAQAAVDVAVREPKTKPVPLPKGLRSLNLLAAKHGRYFGTAVDAIWQNNDTKYLELSGDFAEFGMITPENYMKWEFIEPTRNHFNFTGGDYIVKWAHSHGAAVRGHNDVWENQLPDWLTTGTWDKNTLISIMLNHIAHFNGHYKGKLYCMDVVNEPFNDDGTWRSDLWYDIIGGPEYVELALEAAHAADPKAKLYINDYNIEYSGPKSDAHYSLAKTLLKKHVPLHGLGVQGHLVVGTVPTSIAVNLARFEKLGLEWAYTELDIRMTLPDNKANSTQQATDYAYVTKTCTDSKACVGITTWETSDDYSWIPGVFPTQGDALLFDKNKNPKANYYAVADALEKAKTKGHFHSFW